MGLSHTSPRPFLGKTFLGREAVQHTIKQEIGSVLTFVAIIWGVFFVDLVVPIDFNHWGIAPRSLWGLVGIPLSPFLHGGFGHLFANTIPLIVLLTLLAGSRTRTWETVVEITLLGGGLLWLFGRAGGDGERIVHVGASGLIYGLIAFLIVAGFREKRFIPLLVALLVGFLYGGTLISGMVPRLGSNVSWDGHLYGAIAGAIIGYFVGATPKASDDSIGTSPGGMGNNAADWETTH